MTSLYKKFLFVFCTLVVSCGLLVTGSSCGEKVDCTKKPDKVTYTWKKTTAPKKVSLYAASMPTSKMAWVVGKDGTILHSSDGGASWKAQTSGVSVTLYGVFFLEDAKHGWAVGEKGTILQTTNSGESWKKLPEPTTATIRSVYFLQKETGFVAGDEFTYLRTSNGGRIWSPIMPSNKINLYAVAYHSNALGYVAGSLGSLFYTSRNDPTQMTTAVTGTNKTFRALAIVNESEAWVVGEEGMVRFSEDSGSSWDKKFIKANAFLTGIGFVSEYIGWAVGKGGLLYGTVDKGQRWSPEPGISGLPDLHGIYVKKHHGLAVGEDGVIALLQNDLSDACKHQ